MGTYREQGEVPKKNQLTQLCQPTNKSQREAFDPYVIYLSVIMEVRYVKNFVLCNAVQITS